MTTAEATETTETQAPDGSRYERYKPAYERYRKSDKGKSAGERYRTSEKGKAAAKRWRDSRKKLPDQSPPAPPAEPEVVTQPVARRRGGRPRKAA